MAFTVSPEAQLTLFKSVFGPEDPITKTVITLIAQGAKIDVSLYVVKVVIDGKIFTQSLSVGTSALIKGSVNDLLKAQSKYLLHSFITNIASAIGLKTLPGLKDSLGPVDIDISMPPPAPPEGSDPDSLDEKVLLALKSLTKPQVKPGVIPLKEAQVIGQQVKGTSSGSVYRVVAVSKGVKVATQLSSYSMSVRVEWVAGAVSPTELASIDSVMDVKAGYASKHLTLGKLSPARVLGAFLYSLETKFDEQVTTHAELKEANA